MVLLVGALGEIDNTHATRGNLSEQAVRTDALVDDGRCALEFAAHQDRRRRQRRLVQKATRFLMGGEERLELLLQGWVIGAGRFKEWTPFFPRLG